MSQFLKRTRQAVAAFLGRQEGELGASQRIGRWVVLTIFFVATLLLVSPFFYRSEVKLREGEMTTRAIVSQIPFEYDDPDRLAEWLERRDREHRRVYTYRATLEGKSLVRLDSLFAATREANLAEADLSTTRGLRALAARLRDLPARGDAAQGFVLSDRTLRTLWTRRNDAKFVEDLRAIIRECYSRGISQNAPQLVASSGRIELQIESADDKPATSPGHGSGHVQPGRVLDYPEGVTDFLTAYLRSYFELAPESDTDAPRFAAREITSALLAPNIVFDAEATRQRRESFAEGKVAVRHHVEPGQVLVAAQRSITDRDREILKAYNAALARHFSQRFAGNAAFVALIVLLIAFFAPRFRQGFTFDVQTTSLVGLPVLVALAIGRFFLLITQERTSLDIVGYAFPAGTIGMLGVLLLDVRMALLLVTAGALLFGLQVDLDFRYVAVGLLGGYAAVAALYAIRERRDVLVAGLRIALVNAVAISALTFIERPADFVWQLPALGALNGILCSLFTIALLPVLEVLFGVVTDMRLLELTGLEHPLLKRMEDEAPGTWQHTLNVSKLAEAGATAIGLNPLLVRAGAYFHDIGKMRKPQYFTENQVTPEDKRRHLELRPQMSTLIIRDHVKSGIEMAREAGLPERITSFIPEHHGTALIKFFYIKAQRQFDEGMTKAPVKIEDYRYPGPKPQSRETAVVMLADSVEATATAKLSVGNIREDDVQVLVRDTIFEKFNDGQFNECDLTLRDLDTLREVFVEQLLSRFHSRIDYPKMTERTR